MLRILKNSGDLRRRMLKIAVPIAVSGLATQAQMLIDTAFLGHYTVHLPGGSTIGGADFLSAVGNVFFPYIVILSFLWSITTGTIVLVSQNLGAGKKDEAERFAEASLKYNTLLSIAVYVVWTLAAPSVFRLMGVQEPVLSLSLRYMNFMCLELFYLGMSVTLGAMFQGMGITRPEMYAGILRSALNIVLDAVLIFGRFGFPEMGIAGAGLATSLSGLISMTVFIFIVYRSRNLEFRPRVSGIIRAKFSRYLKVIRVGLPTGIEDSLWNFGNLVIASFLNRLNAAAVGIYRLVTQIEVTPVFFYYGIARAVTTLVGFRTGERRIDLAKRTVFIASFDTMLFCLSFVALFMIFPRTILGIFTDSPEIVNASAPYLMIVAVTMIPRAINIISGNGIRGYGDTLWMLVTQIFGVTFVILLSRHLIFDLKIGMVGLFVALFLDETIRGIINSGRFYRGEYSFFYRKPLSVDSAAETAEG